MNGIPVVLLVVDCMQCMLVCMCFADMLATRYELVRMNMNWTNAHLYCNAHRTNLVVILSQVEHLALQAYLESNAG